MDGTDLDRTIALARALLHGTGALQVSMLMDPADGPGEPGAVRMVRFGSTSVIDADGTERELPHDAGADTPLPALPEMKQLPAFEIDAITGSVTGAIGGISMLADVLMTFASLVGGRSVVAADFETTTPDLPLGLAARVGEPVAVILGDDEFALPDTAS